MSTPRNVPGAVKLLIPQAPAAAPAATQTLEELNAMIAAQNAATHSAI